MLLRFLYPIWTIQLKLFGRGSEGKQKTWETPSCPSAPAQSWLEPLLP
jgi:hypothetical protein